MNRFEAKVLEIDRPAGGIGHPVEVQSLGGNLFKAVSQRVPLGSTCTPVVCSHEMDTHLLFTYCHRTCDETLRVPMDVKILLAGGASATLIHATLPYAHSESFSVKRLLGVNDFRGVCFAWSQRPGDSKGFRIKNRRLAPIYFAFYEDSRSGKQLDCVHCSPSRSNYGRERVFWVPEEGASITAIVCAPLDAYQSRAPRLTYTFGLREEGTPWRYAHREVSFTPSLWVNLGELLEASFKGNCAYHLSIQGPKGKGWIMTQTSQDFNLHHL